MVKGSRQRAMESVYGLPVAVQRSEHPAIYTRAFHDFVFTVMRSSAVVEATIVGA
jgi:hypothetical protein